MVGDETELKKRRRDFSVFVRKSDFRSHFERPGLTSVGRFQILSLPPIVVVGFYESRYHAYVQMNDLAGHNYAVIIDYRSLSATVH